MNKIPKPTICILDCDGLLFEAAAAGEQVWYSYKDQDGVEIARFNSAQAGKNWLEECVLMGADIQYGYSGDHSKLIRHTEHEIKDVELCYKTFKNGLKRILKATGCKQMKAYISKKSGLKNFRYHVATIHEYKKGRSKQRKPHHLEAVRDYARTLHEVTVARGVVECDDKVVEVAEKLGHKACLTFEDKDSLQGRGCWLFHLNKHTKPVWSNPDKIGRLGKRPDGSTGMNGYLSLCYQLIKGDKAVDGIVGLPKYGDTTAFNILSKYDNQTVDVLPEVVREVLSHYYKVYGSTHTYTHWDGSVEVTAGFREIFEENLLLLWMRRFSNDRAEHIMEIVRDITEEEMEGMVNDSK